MVTDPGEMRTAVQKALVDATMAYINAHPTRVSDSSRFEGDWKPLVKLRTSILYRFDSLVFHVALIEGRQKDCFAAITRDPKRMVDQKYVRELIVGAKTQMNFLFDDLAFSALSLFDYYGRLISLLQRTKPIKNHKWTGVLTWAKSEQAASSSLKTVEVVLRQNTEWLQGMADFRNRLIHEENDPAGAEWNWNFKSIPGRRSPPGGGLGTPGNLEVGVLISTPSSFRDSLPHLRNTTTAPLGLVSSVQWVLGQTMDAVCELAGALVSDLPHSPWIAS